MGVRTYDILSFPKDEEIISLRMSPKRILRITVEMALQGGEEEPIKVEVTIQTLALFDVFSDERGRQQGTSIYGVARHKQFGNPDKEYIIDIEFNPVTKTGIAETRAK